MSEDVRPFATGSQYGAWKGRNCHRCAKYNEDKYDGACEIDGALGLAYIGHGHVAADIAERMGCVLIQPEPYTWDCPEREARP